MTKLCSIDISIFKRCSWNYYNRIHFSKLNFFEIFWTHKVTRVLVLKNSYIAHHQCVSKNKASFIQKKVILTKILFIPIHRFCLFDMYIWSPLFIHDRICLCEKIAFWHLPMYWWAHQVEYVCVTTCTLSKRSKISVYANRSSVSFNPFGLSSAGWKKKQFRCRSFSTSKNNKKIFHLASIYIFL